MGGININNLASELQNEGIQVEALFTVDAYKPLTSSEQEISSNVEVNWNFYQTSITPPFFSKGGINYAESSNLTTVINTLKENSNHKNIDEKTNSAIFRAFAGKIIQNK